MNFTLVYRASFSALGDGSQTQPQCDASGNLKVVAGAAGTLPTGAATSAKQDAALNGATATSRILSAAATTNATSAKASAGTVRTVSGYNARASAVYLKFYNKATAPTVGSDTPRKTVYLPATSAFCLDFEDYYATGIAYAMTTAGADADTGALTAGDILALNIDYL